ncbi:MAG: bifunctional pyr operon transcriptional regulator/uracil phosphoribosyltransferase PyrR [Pseudomonadota bacterium]
MSKTQPPLLEVEPLLAHMAEELRALLRRRHIADPVMIGIQTGGVWLAERLHDLLDITHPLGRLDISFYRDDFTRLGLNPQVKPSYLPFNLDDRHIILVDDVLHTGRTVRAALNEIFDYGRPKSVLLAVLVERSGRELPIEASVVGQHLDLTSKQHVKLTGPEPLRLVVQSAT